MGNIYRPQPVPLSYRDPDLPHSPSAPHCRHRLLGSRAQRSQCPTLLGHFLDPDIITESDPTTYQSMVESGRGDRWMYDRRPAEWVFLRPYLFDASFDDGLEIEIQVNPEFYSVAAAREQAERFAPIIGRLPTGLRKDVQTVWIHLGTNPFGGGNNNLLIHTGQADEYVNDGILEEVFVHEAAHTSLDADHAEDPSWLAAQQADPEFISTYANDNPNREDIAESYLLYLALRHRADRISQDLATTIAETIPNRIQYFDDHPIDLYPIVPPHPLIPKGLEITQHEEGRWILNWSTQMNAQYAVDQSEDLHIWREIVGPMTARAETMNVEVSSPHSSSFFRVRQIEAPSP